MEIPPPHRIPVAACDHSSRKIFFSPYTLPEFVATHVLREAGKVAGYRARGTAPDPGSESIQAAFLA